MDRVHIRNKVERKFINVGHNLNRCQISGCQAMRRPTINSAREKFFASWLQKEQQFAAFLFHANLIYLVLGNKRGAVRIISKNDLGSAAGIKSYIDFHIFVQLIN